MAREDPGIYVPIARLLHVPPHIARMAQQTALAQTRRDIDDLSQRYHGTADMPPEPILLYGPDGSQTLIVGGGETEVAELQEMAIAAMEQGEQTAKQTGGSTVDFDEIRERRGARPRAEFDQRYREMWWRRAERLKDALG